MKTVSFKTHRKTTVIITLLCFIMLMAFSFGKKVEVQTQNPILIKKDSISSVRAFRQVYRVLMSPRCMNCHPSGNIPLQGDDHHPHTMSPKRGTDGRGVLAMKCMNCHQPENSREMHTPPGNPNWHLPPADMKMVFQGRSAYQLAKQLVNPKLNGNKSIKQLIEHADDGLVKWAWTPGEGRTLPPLTHTEFKKAWITWITTGAYPPNP
jgi:hypothetical protein